MLGPTGPASVMHCPPHHGRTTRQLSEISPDAHDANNAPTGDPGVSAAAVAMCPPRGHLVRARLVLARNPSGAVSVSGGRLGHAGAHRTLGRDKVRTAYHRSAVAARCHRQIRRCFGLHLRQKSMEIDVTSVTVRFPETARQRHRGGTSQLYSSALLSVVAHRRPKRVLWMARSSTAC